MSRISFRVNGREISESAPTFVIAEAACNHMCDVSLAKKMIQQAKEAGADAVKFQTYKADRLVCADAPIPWSYTSGVKTQLEYYKRLDRFDRAEYRSLFEYGKNIGIAVFSTPFDVDSASMLYDLGAPLFKIASCDLLDVRLIRHVARLNKPMIISTGGGELSEIKNAVACALNAGNPHLVVMACTMSYPAANEEANLRRITTLRETFPDILIGYSDHTAPDKHMVIDSVAVALGARVIEKHYTLDRTMEGSGHSFSAEPKDLKAMIENIRLTETVLGESQVGVYDFEKKIREGARRSLVAKRNIQKGETIADDMVAIKRPGTGLSPDHIDTILGKAAKEAIAKDSQISWDHLEV